PTHPAALLVWDLLDCGAVRGLYELVWLAERGLARGLSSAADSAGPPPGFRPIVFLCLHVRTIGDGVVGDAAIHSRRRGRGTRTPYLGFAFDHRHERSRNHPR